jgi:hypothetical protein
MLTPYNPETETPVKVLKLIGGQEIIGKVIIEDIAKIEMANVRELLPVPQPNGTYTLTLVPYIHINGKDDARVIINMTAVAAILKKIPKELEDEYLTAVSGIVRASATEAALFKGK